MAKKITFSEVVEHNGRVIMIKGLAEFFRQRASTDLIESTLVELDRILDERSGNPQKTPNTGDHPQKKTA